jgi:pyridoxamine 5'-phosphate oxidase
MKDLGHYRKSYEKSELTESVLPEHPLELFSAWFHQTEESGGADEVNAMTLSTINADGFPKSRIVLLKRYAEEGFVFFTNYESEKGDSITRNPKVCLSFFWYGSERQVIITGVAQKTTKEESDEYFSSRPRGSQLGAVLSKQSRPVASREFLEKELLKLEQEHANKTIARPEHWGGYIVKPLSIEFWQGRPNRLHDRILYTLTDSRWTWKRLQP